MTVANGAASIEELKARAKDIRCDIIDMLEKSGTGHPGGSLSSTDLMTALYFGGIMNYDPADPKMDGRDYFILSKGHAAPVLYATLAEAGFFPKEELSTLRKFHSRLQGHPDSKKLPGVEVCTGSLGQGLSIADGLALGLRENGSASKVFTIMGDGEIQEGQVWEAAMFAAHYKLDNLVAVVDNNTLQIDGNVSNVMNLGDIAAKFAAFGWETFEIDGHDMEAILDAFKAAVAVEGKPAVIVAHTVKGKGVSFMEGLASWHGTAPNKEQRDAAIAELTGQEA